MNMNLKKILARFLLLILSTTVTFTFHVFSQDKKKNISDTDTYTSIVLEIGQPNSGQMAIKDENLQKELNYFLKIAAIISEKNHEKALSLLGKQIKGKISRLLEAAAESETQDFYKQYLNELAINIRERGRFFVESPTWVSLEQERLEIIFPRADRYSAALYVLQTFFNIPLENHNWGRDNFFDAVVYLNDPDVTFQFKKYTDIFPQMQDHLYNLSALANMRQEIAYAPVIPSFKISSLIFTSQPKIVGPSLVYPDVDEFAPGQAENYKNEDEGKFKVIIFENLVNAYFEGVLKPISARLLTTEQVWGLDAEIYLSNLIMRRIAHHLGPVLVINSKGEDNVDKIGKILQKNDQRMELKTVAGIMGNLFPVVEAVKSQAAAIYNTPVLIDNGLLAGDKVENVYLIYLISLIDRLRNTPQEIIMPPPPGKKNWEELLGNPGKENYLAALIQFNYLLAKEGIILNVDNHTLAINREKFASALGELTGEIIRLMAYPNNESVGWFIEKNSALSPYLREILKSIEDIPYQVKFHLETPVSKLAKEEQ